MQIRFAGDVSGKDPTVVWIACAEKSRQQADFATASYSENRAVMCNSRRTRKPRTKTFCYFDSARVVYRAAGIMLACRGRRVHRGHGVERCGTELSSSVPFLYQPRYSHIPMTNARML